MKARQSLCPIETKSDVDFVDVTDAVSAAYARAHMSKARVTVFATEPGSRVFINERESGLIEDLRRAIVRIREAGAPVTLGSASVVLPAVGDRLLLGPWQRVFLAELEGPKRRHVLVQVTGE